MSDDDQAAPIEWKVSWVYAQRPIVFHITTEGELSIEYAVQFGFPDAPQVRLGLVIPAEEVKTLRRGLAQIGTMQDTLSAKRPNPGAH